jgi:tetratricopeptide (TPR) repeat protein
MKKRNSKLRCNPGSRKSRTHRNSKPQRDALSQKTSKLACALFKIAYAQYLQGDLKASVRNFESGLKINPTNVKARIWLAKILIFVCEFENAISQLTIAIQIDPLFLNSYLTRGRAYLGAGKYDEAIDDFNFVIIHFPDSVDAFIGRGDSKYAKNDFKGALDDYTCAAKINPSLNTALGRIDQINNFPILVHMQCPKVSFLWLMLYLKRFRGEISRVLNCGIIMLIISFNEQIMGFVELVEV